MNESLTNSALCNRAESIPVKIKFQFEMSIERVNIEDILKNWKNFPLLKNKTNKPITGIFVAVITKSEFNPKNIMIK